MQGARRIGIGVRVILVLGALTAIEYAIAIAEPPGQLPLIFAIALAKAVPILICFMHVNQIWGGEHS